MRSSTTQRATEIYSSRAPSLLQSLFMINFYSQRADKILRIQNARIILFFNAAATKREKDSERSDETPSFILCISS